MGQWSSNKHICCHTGAAYRSYLNTWCIAQPVQYNAEHDGAQSNSKPVHRHFSIRYQGECKPEFVNPPSKLTNIPNVSRSKCLVCCYAVASESRQARPAASPSPVSASSCTRSSPEAQHTPNWGMPSTCCCLPSEYVPILVKVKSVL